MFIDLLVFFFVILIFCLNICISLELLHWKVFYIFVSLPSSAVSFFFYDCLQSKTESPYFPSIITVIWCT